MSDKATPTKIASVKTSDAPVKTPATKTASAPSRKPAKKATKKFVPRVPKAATLLVYLEDYMKASKIKDDAPISNVLGSLKESIITESTAKIRER